jgi:hypothetical protein
MVSIPCTIIWFSLQNLGASLSILKRSIELQGPDNSEDAQLHPGILPTMENAAPLIVQSRCYEV